jgi:hypothetical protein
MWRAMSELPFRTSSALLAAGPQAERMPETAICEAPQSEIEIELYFGFILILP